MEKSIVEIYRDDLRFLLRLKASVSILHNRLHDNLAVTAIEELKKKHPGTKFSYTKAGASGIDITGIKRREIKVVAEVKTTLPDEKGRLRGPQTKTILKDLQRLSDHKHAESRYLIVLSPTTKRAIEKQLKTRTKFPMIKIFNALDENYSESKEDES
ncbi:MAG: hypothetical protein WAX69_05475 [Victivallales bacterium]